MQNVFLKRLYEYMKATCPDVLLRLEEEGKLMDFLVSKVESIEGLFDQLLTLDIPLQSVQEICMEELTADLKPSAYNYVNRVLQEGFPIYHKLFSRSGVLTYEITNLIEECKPVLEAFGFSDETDNSSMLYYAVTGVMSEYLESKT